MNLLRGCWLLFNEQTRGWDVGRNGILLLPPHVTDLSKDTFVLCVKDGARESCGFALPIETTMRGAYGIPSPRHYTRFLGADGTLLGRSDGAQTIHGAYAIDLFCLKEECVDPEQEYVALYVRRLGP